MTAHTMAHEKESSSAAGMNDHLGKPFEAGAFYRLLAKWLPAARQFTPATPGQAAGLAGTPALPEIDGIATQAGLERFAGNDARYRHWLNDFVGESAGFVEAIDRLRASAAHEAARQMAHAFKGRVGMLGMSELHRLLTTFEKAIAAGEECREIGQQVAQSIETLRASVRSALAGSPAGAPQGNQVTPDAVARPSADPLPPAIAALLPRLDAADGDSAAAIEDCLVELQTTAWPPLLRAALAQVQRFDFEAAARTLAPRPAAQETES